MVDADRLRIVFRVNGISFVMPVAELLAIRGSDEDDLLSPPDQKSPMQIGLISYRDADVRVYDLAALFGLGDFEVGKEHKRLVFAGADGPWAVPVEDVSGIVNVDQFSFQDLPEYWFAEEGRPYQQVAIYQDRLLVSTNAYQVDSAWQRST